MRFTPEHVQQWRSEGFAIIENFFRPEEYEPVLADFEALHGKTRDSGPPPPPRPMSSSDDRHFNWITQFKNIHIFPYDASSALNLISLQPDLIAFARALLGVSDVHLYQSHTWAKFTGEADYDQAFHCDFGNHTLAVPADEPRLRSADFILYLTDVKRELGAMRYVTKSDVVDALGAPVLSPGGDEQQALLRERERAVVVPAGSIVAHGIDTMHRGSNLTETNGRRFSITIGYKAAGNDLIGFHVWQARGNRPWQRIFQHATPEQLACLGIPKPGDPFWSPRTLQLTQSRWPDWDMREYVAACPDAKE